MANFVVRTGVNLAIYLLLIVSMVGVLSLLDQRYDSTAADEVSQVVLGVPLYAFYLAPAAVLIAFGMEAADPARRQVLLVGGGLTICGAVVSLLVDYDYGRVVVGVAALLTMYAALIWTSHRRPGNFVLVLVGSLSFAVSFAVCVGGV